VLVLSCSGCPGDTTGAALYTLAPGGNLRMIPGTAGAQDPAWSPRGRRVAYAGRWHELLVTNEAGDRTRRIAGPYPVPVVGSSDWSPDGRELVFVRYVPRPIGSYRGSLWRIPAAGGRARLLHAPRYSLNDPSWSPDGRRIAYADQRQFLWAIPAQGGVQRRLGPVELRGSQPRWSPDGARVAFIRYGAALSLSVLDLRTSRVRSVLRLDPSMSQVFDHAWSPDGRWLALSRTLKFPCEGVPPPGLCQDLQVLAVRVRDRAVRILYRGDGEPGGLDWRR
jgi:TolB protein